MNEKQTLSPELIRPTKRQRELLTYIGAFIEAHGYSPSYREIMTGLNYTSVATVALHVNSLIKRGHLRKRDYSARSLELTRPSDGPRITTNQVAASEERWLVDKIEHFFAQAEQAGTGLSQPALNELYVLLGVLQILGLQAAAQSFQGRINQLKQRTTKQDLQGA